MAQECDRGLFRPLLPRPGPESAEPARQLLPTTAEPPKRSTVKAACEQCRRRKVKCDGRRPGCFPCAKSGRTCEYVAEPSERRASAVKRKNDELQQQKHDELQQRLANHTKLQDLLLANPEASGSILKRLRLGDDVTSVVREVQHGEALLSLAHGQYATSSPQALESATYMNSYTPTPRHSSSAGKQPVNSWQPSRRQLPSRFDHPEFVFEEAFRDAGSFHDPTNLFLQSSSHRLPISRWTTVPLSDELLNHIMLLLWTWDPRITRIVDRKMFEEDLQNKAPTSDSAGALRFCSPFLVNVLLAMYTTNIETYSIPSDHYTRGEAFAKEARRLLALERSENSLPFTQGLAIFYHYEGNFGTLESTMNLTSICYRQCKKLHLEDLIQKRMSPTASSREVREAEALSWIAWGFYIHENYIAGPMNHRKILRKPDIPKLWQDTTQSSPEEEFNDSWWFAYPVSLNPQRSFKREIFNAECDLMEIFEDIMDFLAPIDNGPNPLEAPEHAVKLYRRLTAWKYSLPEYLQSESCVLPSALQFYVNFDLTAMSVLRPFHDVTKDQFGGLVPKATSQFHASHIMSTIWTFRALYTVRHEFWHTHPCSVCAFSVLDDLDLGPMHVEIVMKACQVLHEMMERFRLPADVLASLKTALKERHVILPSSTVNILKADIEAPEPTIMQYTIAVAVKKKRIESRCEKTAQVKTLRISDLLIPEEEAEIGLD
ncbi:hypothetical protein S7711_07091 [Stachybotrys chartarum IBT 7711]|uniref:Zn(2)-C6 fungal-type domain-containing protein n=1 Tax=Stachybotrys chartarum (strain CBS 109288 / IBT 7711) TaxID=1280523 RepID=A0A084B313_STACB|nr:hypothetical protein S7711_07091 [Stachybotrys chartarum IBT 7711]